MSTCSREHLYDAALKHYGIGVQLMVAAEECSELSAAILQMLRGRSSATVEAVALEIADVEIMVEQLRRHFGDDVIDSAKRAKLERLAMRVGAA